MKKSPRLSDHLTKCQIMILLALCMISACTPSTPSRSKSTANRTEKSKLPTDPGDFRCPSDIVPEEYVEFAAQKGIFERLLVSDLYFKAISLMNPKDKITGYDPASFYFPNMAKFAHRSRQLGDAVYLEVDIGNLGGMNSILTNAGADLVLRQMTAFIDTELTLFASSRKMTICKVRHGGDEFSYFLKSSDRISILELEKSMTIAKERSLNYAQNTKIEDILVEVEDPNLPVERFPLNCLSQIPHPKKTNEANATSFAGIGLYFAAVAIPPTDKLIEKTDQVREYFQSRVMVPAGKIINTAKKSPLNMSNRCRD